MTTAIFYKTTASFFDLPDGGMTLDKDRDLQTSLLEDEYPYDYFRELICRATHTDGRVVVVLAGPEIYGGSGILDKSKLLEKFRGFKVIDGKKITHKLINKLTAENRNLSVYEQNLSLLGRSFIT